MAESETNDLGTGADPSAAGAAAPAFEPRAGARTAEVTIEKLVYGGAGLARIGGQVALVPFVLPGEVARIAIAAERPGMLAASVCDIVAKSDARADPPCPHFSVCGGCHYQHAAYPFQLQQKVAILRETMKRVGKLDAPPEIDTIAGEPLGYRNRTQFHTDGSHIGYFGIGSRRLVRIRECPIASPKVNATLRALRGMLRDRRWPRFLRSLEVFTNEADVQVNVRESRQPVARRFFDWCAERVEGFAPGAIEYEAAGERYRVGGGSFFQVNRFLAGPLAARALEGAEGESALDLYAGVGLFSLPLARRFQRVAAVESGQGAVRDLEFNAQRAGLAVGVHRSSAESFLENLETAPDFVLADPPRAGLGKSAVRSLLRLEPPRLTIVSCDPATLARDLAALVAGAYAIQRVTLVDLFPQTFHIETVTNLVRK